MRECDEVLQWISDDLDGVLDPEHKDRLEAHLSACPQCRLLRDSLGAVKDEMGGMEAEPPKTLLPGIMTRVEEEGTSKRRIFSFPAVGRFTAVAAVACVVLFAVSQLTPYFRPSDSGAPQMALMNDAGNAEDQMEADAYIAGEGATLRDYGAGNDVTFSVHPQQTPLPGAITGTTDDDGTDMQQISPNQGLEAAQYLPESLGEYTVEAVVMVDGELSVLSKAAVFTEIIVTDLTGSLVYSGIYEQELGVLETNGYAYTVFTVGPEYIVDGAEYVLFLPWVKAPEVEVEVE